MIRHQIVWCAMLDEIGLWQDDLQDVESMILYETAIRSYADMVRSGRQFGLTLGESGVISSVYDDPDKAVVVYTDLEDYSDAAKLVDPDGHMIDGALAPHVVAAYYGHLTRRGQIRIEEIRSETAEALFDSYHQDAVLLRCYGPWSME